MEFNDFSLWGMIFLNTVFCVTLPKIVSLDWFNGSAE